VLGGLAGVEERERLSSAREERKGGQGLRRLFNEGRYAERNDKRVSLLDRAVVKSGGGGRGAPLSPYPVCVKVSDPDLRIGISRLR